MKLFSFLAKKRKKNKIGSFAEFFLHASEKEKKRVFTDAARLANEDQRKLVESINKFQQKAT